MSHPIRRAAPECQRRVRRRRALARDPNPAFFPEALAIPHGTGENLTDRQRMILANLSSIERHNRATKVYSNRGEFYGKYKYLTTMDDAFLVMCGILRAEVPRWVGARPGTGTQNVEQMRLEEEARQRRAAGFPVPVMRFAAPNRTLAPRPGRQSSTFSQQQDSHGHYFAPVPSASGQQDIQVDIPGLTNTITATLFPDLIEPEAMQCLKPSTQGQMLCFPVSINLRSTTYEEVCKTIMNAFSTHFSGTHPMNSLDIYVGTFLAVWSNPRTGVETTKKVYDHNYRSEIVPFLAAHPVVETALAFGLDAGEFGPYGEDDEEMADLQAGFSQMDSAEDGFDLDTVPENDYSLEDFGEESSEKKYSKMA